MPEKKFTEHKYAYDKQYYKNNIVRKVLNFNQVIPEDAELLEWLESQENFSQYIKYLVREDMLKGRTK